MYSPDFRRELEDRYISDGQKLCSRIDMQVQQYTNGAHLMCHDDVISTRKLTFVLYLTDPDQNWSQEDGGGHEIYTEQALSLDEDAKSNDKLLPVPVTEVLPQFNR